MSEFQFKVGDRVERREGLNGEGNWVPDTITRIDGSSLPYGFAVVQWRAAENVRRQTFKPGDLVRVVRGYKGDDRTGCGWRADQEKYTGQVLEVDHMNINTGNVSLITTQGELNWYWPAECLEPVPNGSETAQTTAQKDCKPENSPEALSIPRDGKLPPCTIEVADEHQAAYLEKELERRGHEKHNANFDYGQGRCRQIVIHNTGGLWQWANHSGGELPIPFSTVCPDYREPGEGKPELDTCTTYQVSFDADEFSCEPTPTFQPGDVIGPVTNKRDARRLEAALKEAGITRWYGGARWKRRYCCCCGVGTRNNFFWLLDTPTKSLSDVLPKENDMSETTTPNLATKIGNGAGWLTSKLVSGSLKYPGKWAANAVKKTAQVGGVSLVAVYALRYFPWNSLGDAISTAGIFCRDIGVSASQFAADGYHFVQGLTVL